jgi:uncharacterized protein YecT (DUF1311 family)
MKKNTWILLLSSFSTISMAGTGLNCSDLDSIGQDDNAMEACITQTDDELNGTYKALKALSKDNKEGLKVLKNMQLGWIKMRDSQCLFMSMNSAGGGGAARTALRCEIEMTIKREKELSIMLGEEDDIELEIPVVGGHTKTDASSKNNIEEASSFASEKMGLKLQEILASSVQSVAGMNYELKLKMINGETYDVIVFEDLQSVMELVSFKKL